MKRLSEDDEFLPLETRRRDTEQQSQLDTETESVKTQPDNYNISPQIVLSCLAFWLFGLVFGLAAFILEFVGRKEQQKADINHRKKAETLRTAAYVVSVVGIVVGWFILVIVLASLLTSTSNNLPTNDTVTDNDTFIQHAKNESLPPKTPYCLPSKECYRFMKYGYSCASCLAVDGVFVNNLCYHNSDNCTGFTVDNHCFKSRQPVVVVSQGGHTVCSSGQYIGHDGFCYYTDLPDCDGGFHVNCACYRYNSTIFTYRTCLNIQGFYFAGLRSPLSTYVNGTCYYNNFNCSGFAVNDQCYLYKSDNYTSGTCRNIDGFTETDSNNITCYNNGLRCPYTQAAGQCFRTSTPVSMSSRKTGNGRCSTCLNTGGTYRNNYCLYYEEVATSYYSFSRSINCSYYKIIDRCETVNDTKLNATECLAVDGYFNFREATCYYTPYICPQYTAECRCYQNMSSDFTRGTCENIGGSYDSSQIACYYNSTHCPYYSVNKQCYQLRNKQSTIYSCDGYYDAFYGICYNNPYRYGP